MNFIYDFMERGGESAMKEKPRSRILLIEDDARLARLVQRYLEANHLSLSIESRGDRASERILLDKPDLVILDILLPGKDGRSVCREVRPEYDGPILMLTALGDETDEIVGLEIGADDYIVKPVSPRLLLSRIQAALRRTSRITERQVKADNLNNGDAPHPIEIGSLLVDPCNRLVSIRGKKVQLTTTEFNLLYFLIKNPGVVLSRDAISLAIRGFEHDRLDRSVDLRIARIRKKLGDNGKQPKLIKSIWGEGYLLVKDL